MVPKQRPSCKTEPRLISFFVSLLFSVPTAVFIWMGVNKELSYWDGFISSSYLLGSIALFGLLALLFPTLFPAVLGSVWRGIAKIQRWWGW
jgi:phosphoglycerol transferase MdoB-like AlkP superfamily enzyme